MLHSGAVHRQSGNLTEIGTTWAVLGPKILMGVAPQILDPICKITPISDLLSYKGCLSVERPRKLGSESKKINFCSKIEYLRSTLYVWNGGIIITMIAILRILRGGGRSNKPNCPPFRICVVDRVVTILQQCTSRVRTEFVAEAGRQADGGIAAMVRLTS